MVILQSQISMPSGSNKPPRPSEDCWENCHGWVHQGNSGSRGIPKDDVLKSLSDNSTPWARLSEHTSPQQVDPFQFSGLDHFYCLSIRSPQKGFYLGQIHRQAALFPKV